MKPKLIRTTIHHYKFDISDPDQKNGHNYLCQVLKDRGLKKFDSYSPNHHAWYRDKIAPLDGQEIELKTDFLFSNQWNTAPLGSISTNGLRVFDWAEAIYDNRDIKEGQWLEQTDEMKDIRRNTNVCGWCGHYESAAKGYVFCPSCLGSQYLTETNLHLTRMVPVEKHLPKREQLTEAEKAHLMPLFIEAQTRAGHTRHNKNIAKKRKQIKEKYERDTENARVEFAGFTWLLDHDVNTDNCLYYSHTGRFRFGWRTPLSAELKSALLDILVEFPFDYDIETEG